MSAHGEQPFISVHDTNGNPVVGAKLYVYEVGTTTLRSIYSNEALSTPISNPLSGVNASDAAGNFPRFYQASGTYKLRCVTSADVLIWEYDNIDTGVASGNPLPIASGGTGATTATDARTNLGVPSDTEFADLASDVASLANSIQSAIGFPQGYLTISSGVPIIPASVTASTNLYYTPIVGTQVPIYSGSTFVTSTFAELTLALVSNHTAGSIYDCFVINDAGTIRLVTGPAWNTATAGAGARGTGAGTTELERLNGLWVNKNDATMRYGATTLSVTARLGTYVGSIRIGSTPGQINCHRAWGQSRVWEIWNAYNRRRIILKAGDSTANWVVAGAGSVRAQNGSTANSLVTLVGLAEEQIDIQLTSHGQISSNQSTSATTGFLRVGIGFDVTNAFSGKAGYLGQVNANMPVALSIGTDGDLKAHYIAPPSIGIHVVTACEQLSNSLSQTLYGGEAENVLSASWYG